MYSGRHILFLQGLPGSFFFRLGSALSAKGCCVYRINFNGGDQWDWPGNGAVNFRGSERDWPSYLATFLREHAITDIILFGDCRRLHRTARGIAAGLGVLVHVFEEGYLRPDWVTLEQGGVNGFSPLSSDPEWYRRQAVELPPVEDGPPLPSSMRRRVRETIVHYVSFTLLAWSFPHYRTHRPRPPLVESMGWLARLVRRRTSLATSNAILRSLRPSTYFLLPLQLESDYQLRAHSDFDGMQAALAEVMASFAARAPADKALVVKAHPLDNGLVDWRKHTVRYAQALGIADRVLFIETGDIDRLVRQSRGVVTVNSTTGTLALAAGVPVITLGRAIYAIPGLVHPGTLDEFWSSPVAPDIDLYAAFRRVLVAQCLLPGGFYANEELAPLVATAADRILNGEHVPLRWGSQRTVRLTPRISWVAAE
ncbi:capsular biosynthesis protein [Hyphomicrobium sp. CS1BSMeth3]|uniref:capsule biosynthesis protein n=1 Tax=Hyphomicrobium sp. CS1BSMeth3 TaxID=1892844 RepID=UPI000931872D|nr:capsular biosynthesis protein [Hyphomicrobium sp. CS1BSMeth3]